MKPILIYDSPITSIGDTGDHAREVAEYICDLAPNYEIYFIDTPIPNTQSILTMESEVVGNVMKKKLDSSQVESVFVYIKLGNPTQFKNIGKYNIGVVTEINTDVISKQDIDSYNKMDHIVVSTNYHRDIISSRINSKISTIPQCIHVHQSTTSDISKLKSYINTIKEEFCFLYKGSWNPESNQLDDRKNVETLIRSFILASTKHKIKPGLILKTETSSYSRSDYIKIHDTISNILKDSHVSNPNIYLIHGHLTSNETKELYRHPCIKATISASRHESFSRSVFESALNNTPILTTDIPSIREYIDDPMFLVGGNKTEIQNWIDIDPHKFSEKISDVIENYETYKTGIEKVSKNLKISHTKKSIQVHYKEVIKSYI
jgi:glycosyltransferase involved in cell wall biosynthesis